MSEFSPQVIGEQGCAHFVKGEPQFLSSDFEGHPGMIATGQMISLRAARPTLTLLATRQLLEVPMQFFDLPAIFLSVSLGLLVAGILWINEVPDIPADAAVGKRTLVVRLGVKRATTVFGGMVIAAYAILVLGVVFVRLTPWALLALLALPLAVKPIRGLRRAGADPHALIPSNAAMVMATIVTGVLLIAGLGISALLAS